MTPGLNSPSGLPTLPKIAPPTAPEIHGDSTGQGVQALAHFLRQGDVLLVDGDSISA